MHKKEKKKSCLHSPRARTHPIPEEVGKDWLWSTAQKLLNLDSNFISQFMMWKRYLESKALIYYRKYKKCRTFNFWNLIRVWIPTHLECWEGDFCIGCPLRSIPTDWAYDLQLELLNMNIWSIVLSWWFLIVFLHRCLCELEDAPLGKVTRCSQSSVRKHLNEQTECKCPLICLFYHLLYYNSYSI